VCGLDRGRRAAEVVVVEGAFDRLAVLSFGDAAVFLGSNQPSEGMSGELCVLARTARLIMLADQDRAGRKGRLRTLTGLDLPPAACVAFANLPPGIKDPGMLTERPDGAAIYRAVRAGARRIDLARFKRLVAACHAAYEARRVTARAAHQDAVRSATRVHSHSAMKGGEAIADVMYVRAV